MKRLYILCAVALLLLGVTSSAGVIEIPSAEASGMSLAVAAGSTPDGGECVKDTTAIVENTDTTSLINNTIDSSDAQGFSFVTPASAGSLYSIDVYIYTVTAGGTMTCRWGPNADLSDAGGTYYDEATYVPDAGDDNVYVALVFDDHDSYSASTTYYFACVCSSGTVSMRDDDDQTDDVAGSTYEVSDGSGWDMSGGGVPYSTRDKLYHVYRCD